MGDRVLCYTIHHLCVRLSVGTLFPYFFIYIFIILGIRINIGDVLFEIADGQILFFFNRVMTLDTWIFNKNE